MTQRAEAPTVDPPAVDRAPSVGRLVELAVSDLALIERLRLPFAAGFNVLTGETGAGKSLLIDALGLATGTRADSALVRHGAEAARVEALFDRLPEPLICVREVAATGRSTARIDDQTVTAARLAEITGPLVEIHGQHDQQRLLDERAQRDLLDTFGGHQEARAAMATAVERWRLNRLALAELSLDPREVARQLEIQLHEADEIRAAGLRSGEADEIRARLEAAQHGEAIARIGGELHESLVGEPRGAREAVAQAARSARQLARLDPRFEALEARLAGVEAEIADVAAEVRELVEGVEHDPRELSRLEERLSLIFSLERRYGDDEAAVIAYGQRAETEAARLAGLDVARTRRAEEDARLLTDVALAAATLSAARAITATRLGGLVSAALEALGFRGATFDVALGRRTAAPDEAAVELDGDAVAFDASGVDQVVYRIAPNPGEPARSLAKIASGGELSRVALAIKEVLATADATPTLVFDEIDTGIGGRSADPVGRSLWALARDHQVLCVTHLPQIAAYADAHFQIAKRERDGRTVTIVERLDHEGRIVELAQMLGGAGSGPASMAGARELLDRAEAWRREVAAE
jgi:DNA repair protein RecN (Recombination protein N)